MNGRRGSGKAGVWACGLGILLSGCDWGSPPPAAEAPEIDVEQALGDSSAFTVGVVLPAEGANARAIWDRSMRLEISLNNAVLQQINPEPGKIDGAIRRAIDSSPPTVLLVVSDSPGEAISGIDEARLRGIPVIALGQAPAKSDGPPIPVVACDSYNEAAKELVASSQKYAKELGEMNAFPAEFQAAIVIPEGKESDPRIGAFEAAIKEAKIDLAPPIKYAPKPEVPATSEAAGAAMEAACAANPKLRMVFSIDDASFDGVLGARDRIRQSAKYKVVAAAFTAYTSNEAYADAGKVAALAQYPVARMAREGLRLARAAKQGESIPPRTEIPFRINRVSAHDEVETRTPPEGQPPTIKPD